jgi:alpha-beta hydrolase superfamily lysophospholipase
VNRTDGPFYFGPGERRLFGWYHEPASGAPARDVGVVFCNPFGFEAICVHRGIRHFAESFTGAGFPSLRFDYDGTGDSAGEDRDADRVRAWVASVHQAVETLKERSGVKRVVLFGTRLGAAIAAAAAAERDDCASLIALSPVLSTDHFLRELATFHAWGRFKPAPDGVSGIAEGDREVSGFVITAATAASLASLDLAKQTRPPARDVLVLERDKRSSSAAWLERLASLGTKAESRFIEGFAEMSVDPHKTAVPTRLIAGALEWLESRHGVVSSRPSAGGTGAPCRECEPAAGVLETPVFVDSNEALFGVLARSKDVPSNGRAILILNAGAIHRIGPNRLWVALARDWVRTGAVVLRLDLSGLGDSRTRGGEDENFVYAKAGVPDLAAAVEFLRRERGVKTFDVVGFCGGGYQAMKAAASGVPLDSVLSVNQQVFFWDPSNTADDADEKTLLAERWHRNSFFSPELWKKIRQGGVPVRAAARVIVWRVVGTATNLGRSAARWLRLPLANDLATELRAVVGGNTRLRFVFSDGEAGEKMLFELAGATARRLERAGAMSIERIPGTNHTFTAAWMQRAFKRAMESWLGIS